MVDHNRQKNNSGVPSLRSLREQLGLTQEELARELGIDRTTIGRHERGVHRVRLSFSQIKRFEELLRAAGLNIQDLPDDLD